MNKKYTFLIKAQDWESGESSIPRSCKDFGSGQAKQLH